MNAKELIERIELQPTVVLDNGRDTILRALRLLDVIEGAEGGTPEMTQAAREGRGIECGCRLERERNAALLALEGARDELANVRAQLADHIGHVSTPIK